MAADNLPLAVFGGAGEEFGARYVVRLAFNNKLAASWTPGQPTRHVAKQQNQVTLAARRGITRHPADGSCGYNGY
jgi:hypothetical protein